MERIPFEEAISERLLLKKPWGELTKPQQAILKIFYGLPLDEEGLRYWSILQGGAEYDHLGYVTRWWPIPYEPKPYKEMWAIIGRRGGKSSTIGALALIYEALLGGHTQYAVEGQDIVIYNVAQKLSVAQSTLKFVMAMINKSPLLKKEYAGEPTAETIRLKNGISILASSPSLRSQRGLSVPVALMDEVGFWYTDSEAANPDIEVERAIRFAQATFPEARLLGISTPYTKEGLLWKYHQAGTEGSKLEQGRDAYKHVLVVHAPTPVMENPHITKERFEQDYARDQAAYEREVLARFTDAISGVFNGKLLELAVEKGVAERPPKKGRYYVAAIDPAFRHDSFAFAICHKERTGKVNVDVLRRWVPIPGYPLNPNIVLDEILLIMRQYGIQHIVSDQYQLESLQQLASQKGLSIEGMDFTSRSKARMYGSLEKLFNTRTIALLDPELNGDAAELMLELRRLEKKQNAGGSISIGAPKGFHDDLATVLALAAHRAVWLIADEEVLDIKKEPTLHERCMATIRKNRVADQANDHFGW